MGSIGKVLFGSRPKTRVEQVPSIFKDPAMEAFYRNVVLPALFSIDAEGQQVTVPPQGQLSNTLRRHMDIAGVVFKELDRPLPGSLANFAPGGAGGSGPGLSDLLANKIAMRYYVDLPLKIALPYIQGQWISQPVVTQTGGSPGLLGAILPGIGVGTGIGLGVGIGKLIERRF